MFQEDIENSIFFMKGYVHIWPLRNTCLCFYSRVCTDFAFWKTSQISQITGSCNFILSIVQKICYYNIYPEKIRCEKWHWEDMLSFWYKYFLCQNFWQEFIIILGFQISQKCEWSEKILSFHWQFQTSFVDKHFFNSVVVYYSSKGKISTSSIHFSMLAIVHDVKRSLLKTCWDLLGITSFSYVSLVIGKTDLSTIVIVLKFNYFCYVERFYVHHVHKEGNELTISLGHFFLQFFL